MKIFYHFSLPLLTLFTIQYNSCWVSGKEPACQCRRYKRCRFTLWSGRSPAEGNGNPIQSSCLENHTDRGAWWPTVHGVTNSWTHWSDLAHIIHILTPRFPSEIWKTELRCISPQRLQIKPCGSVLTFRFFSSIPIRIRIWGTRNHVNCCGRTLKINHKLSWP